LTETIYSKSSTNTIDPSSPKYPAKLFLALVILLSALARLWRLTAGCLWFDEIFSVHAAEHSWGSVLHFVAADLVHPPLFYIVLKIWIGIGGESLLWLRLFPAIASIAAIVPVLLLARELKLSMAETTLALLLLAVSGYLIKYAQEVRMYGLLFLLSACSLWLFASWWRSEKQSTPRFVALMAINLLMVYTHYFAWVLVLLELVLAVYKCRRVRQRIITGFAILVMCYVPWLIEVAQVYKTTRLEQNLGWIPRPGLRAMIELATLLNQPFVFPNSSADNAINLFVVLFVLLVFVCPLAVLFWQMLRTRRSQQHDSELLLILSIVVPVMTLAVMSWILPQSIWGTRHLIIITVPYSVLAAMAIVRLQPYWARVSVFLIASGWFAAAAVYVLIRPAPQYIWCAWAPLAQEVRQTTAVSSSPTSIYAFEDLVAYHLWFALKDSQYFRVSVIKGLPGITEDSAYFLPRDFDGVLVRAAGANINDNEIWVAFRATRLDEHQPPLNRFTSAGYQIERVLTEHMQGQEAFMIKLQRKQE
jgi:uncharacterized membrane protein